ncbi:MAG: hypothetical protein KIT80_23305 [Chitinophagaceae bacterium]|nr:hypothetical protein [Nitrosomonas sp.]MCW5929867.1 hypothetical protein [Chitinophagaceae bacterium]
MVDKKEILDQSLHFLYGLVATAILSVFVGIVAAFPIVTMAALIRERKQHPDRPISILFNIDMAFILAGQITCTLLLMM